MIIVSSSYLRFYIEVGVGVGTFLPTPTSTPPKIPSATDSDSTALRVTTLKSKGLSVAGDATNIVYQTFFNVKVLWKFYFSVLHCCKLLNLLMLHVPTARRNFGLSAAGGTQ
jgi:hypothetical protein